MSTGRDLFLKATNAVHRTLFNVSNGRIGGKMQAAGKAVEDPGICTASGAREVRRAYVGLKMKLEVLATEGGDTPETRQEVAKAKARLGELRDKFSALKQERIRIGHLIEEGDAKVDAVDEKLKEEKQQRRLQASEAFELIGEGNKELSILRAESGVLDTQMRQLYAEIGRYVSRNTKRDPACAAASAAHHGLVEVMRALRRSVALNHRLAGTSS